MSLSGFERRILLTLAYSNSFNFPLNSREIWLRLLTAENISYKQVKESLIALHKKQRIQKEDDYYFLSSVDSKNLVSVRKNREQYSQKKITQAEKFISKAKKIPFIKAIVITGSVSVSNAKKNDDIDWLIITANNTLWLVRPLVILIATFYGKRRERDGHHRDNSWCFNMFLSEDRLEIHPQKKSTYTAYEVCQALFVYDAASVEEKFLLTNSWVNQFVANYWQVRLHEVVIRNQYGYVEQTSEVNLLIQWLNKILFYVQLWYMKKRMTREVVKHNIALFHPRNTKRNVVKKWKEIVQRVT